MSKWKALLIVGIAASVAVVAIRRGKERKGRKMHKSGVWRYCPACGEYSHTLETHCDNTQHETTELHDISIWQTARVTTALTSSVARKHIETQEEYYAFGSFYLWIEATTRRKWDTSSAMCVFLLSEEDQTVFYDLMRGYEAILPSYLPSGLIKVWFALRKDTAKVVRP